MSSPSHSDSDSDSDREPNSRGARVFWGNVKTPERSRSIFVDPPKTVVKSTKPRSPRSLTLSTRDDGAVDKETEDIQRDNDGSPHPTSFLKTLIAGAETPAVDLNLTPRDIQHSDKDGISHLLEGHKSELPKVSSTQSPLAALKARFSNTGSESATPDAATLHSSSVIHMPLDGSPSIEAHELQDNCAVARSKSSSPIPTLLKDVAHIPLAPQLPDLISFDIPVPTQLPPTDSSTGSAIHSESATNQLTSSSSYVIIDKLLTLSPRRTESQFLSRPLSPPGHLRFSEYQPVVSNLYPSSPEPSVYDSINNDPSSSGQSSTLSNQLSIKVDYPIDTSEALSRKRDARDGTIQHEVETAMAVVTKPDDTLDAQTTDEARVQTTKRMGNALSHTSGAHTRKRTMSKGKARADDRSASPGELLPSASNESNEHSSHGDEMALKAVKKERRTKAKEEAERRRPLLMSLSPTSADVLNFLASPGRSSPPALSPLRAPGNLVFECISVGTPTQPKASCTPQQSPNTPARRIPITNTSPRRLDGPPLHLNRPSPVRLDDPRRTPARRVPVPTSTSQPRHLPLNDPNRTPARRVPITLSFPTKSVEKAVISGAHARQTDESSVASSSVPPMKLTNEPQPLGGDGVPGDDLASLLETPVVTTSLPFPIVQQPFGGKKLNADLPRLSPPLTSANSPSKPPPPSHLRQPSSISTSKIGRVGAKPYSRPGHLQSRLPKPSSSRLPIPGTGFGHTNGGVGTIRIKHAPTRIPSPIKQQAPSVGIPGPVIVPPTAPDASTGGPPVEPTYRRKRPRMMLEDDASDEPPAKRPTITIRLVTKGMFNKATSDLGITGSSTSRREASPNYPPQTPPIVPNTSEPFMTTQNSSHGFLKNVEKSTQADIDTPASHVLGSSTPEPRGGSPAGDTDTASTVTTLSREPTLDDMPIASSSFLGPEPSFTTLAESWPEPRRTTRVRKTSSALATRREPLPLTRTTAIVRRGASSSTKASNSSTRTSQVSGVIMNQRQLQAITQANTARNQIYSADLQHRVVRKDGPRPASPTTKVRTIMEKAKEAEAQAREARAERRRRRDQGSSVSAHSEDDSVGFKEISSSPLRYSVSGRSNKHVRGPGDEEDYETPERAPKPSRLDPGKISKNVKWDRSLARSLSEFAKQAAKQAQEGESIKKGCLARDPKTLHLDPLGNVPDANIPLDNLGHERVIVTRFIYDDDDDDTEARVAKKKKS